MTLTEQIEALPVEDRLQLLRQFCNCCGRKHAKPAGVMPCLCAEHDERDRCVKLVMAEGIEEGLARRIVEEQQRDERLARHLFRTALGFKDDLNQRFRRITSHPEYESIVEGLDVSLIGLLRATQVYDKVESLPKPYREAFETIESTLIGKSASSI